jgi:DNA repair exonuclease SbcCD nuclease subunit
MHYWALGHIHTRTVEARTWGAFVYPGNLQGRSFKPAECGPKGATLIQVEGVGPVGASHLTHIDCDSVRFVRIVVDITGEAAVNAADLVADAARKAQVEAGRPVVARVALTGRIANRARLQQQVDDGSFLAVVREALPFSAHAFAWVDSVSLDVRSEYSIDDVERRTDFTGEVVRSVRSLNDEQLHELATELVERAFKKSGAGSGISSGLSAFLSTALRDDPSFTGELVVDLAAILKQEREAVAEMFVDLLDAEGELA